EVIDEPVVEYGEQPPVEEASHVKSPEARQLETTIANILRTGVVSAAVLLTISMPWLVFQDRSHRAHRLSVGEALRRVPDLDPHGLAAIGVLILIVTPILQLITSAVLFWKKKDRLYVGLTVLVCGIITMGALFTSH
ncbi:MAG TPA: DUF1634 domain-containing protein, partial [Acidimicrobiia bacterium]|nr:DUF1634 domain-containing protein [Acidimicrobiia bacterium]